MFRSRKGGHLDESQVWRIVRKASKRAGIEKEVSCHWLRHAHASHALDRGAPIHLVQATLGAFVDFDDRASTFMPDPRIRVRATCYKTSNGIARLVVAAEKRAEHRRLEPNYAKKVTPSPDDCLSVTHFKSSNHFPTSRSTVATSENLTG